MSKAGKLFQIRFNEDQSMKTVLQFPGRFQVWSYTVSHGQLLLRRAKSNDHPTRVDVLFSNVPYMRLATVFDQLHVSEEDIATLPSLGALSLLDRLIYSINGSNTDGLVIAGSVVAHEDQGEYDEPSHLSLP